MRRKETIVEALDVTKDAALGMPVVTAVGNCEVYVENFKSIAEYDCNTVKLLTKKGFLSIKGERLEILYYDEEEKRFHKVKPSMIENIIVKVIDAEKGIYMIEK